MERLMGWQWPEPFLSRDIEIEISMLPFDIITIFMTNFKYISKMRIVITERNTHQVHH